jgi:hypothetical protein
MKLQLTVTLIGFRLEQTWFYDVSKWCHCEWGLPLSLRLGMLLIPLEVRYTVQLLPLADMNPNNEHAGLPIHSKQNYLIKVSRKLG